MESGELWDTGGSIYWAFYMHITVMIILLYTCPCIPLDMWNSQTFIAYKHIYVSGIWVTNGLVDLLAPGRFEWNFR